MRDVMPEYYTPNNSEFKDLWSSCIFAFDANVLLDVYRFSPSTSEQLLSIIQNLSDRVWIPNQAAAEYQVRRRDVVAKQLGAYSRFADKLKAGLKELQESLNKYTDSPETMEPIQAAIESAAATLEKAQEGYEKRVPSETLHERLSELLVGKVGKAYSAADLPSHYAEAERRIKEKIPPGFKDENKQIPARYGDCLVWFQLLDHGKATGKPIVFVTGDAKEDWWLREQGKTIGPRPELRREMLDKTGVLGYLYNTEQFLEHARQYLEIVVAPEAIEEARALQQQSASAAVDSLAIGLAPGSRVTDLLPYLPSGTKVEYWPSGAIKMPNPGVFLTLDRSPTDWIKIQSTDVPNRYIPVDLTQNPYIQMLGGERTLRGADGVPIRVALQSGTVLEGGGFVLRIEKNGAVRTLANYPPNWNTMPDADLLVVCEGAFQ